MLGHVAEAAPGADRVIDDVDAAHLERAVAGVAHAQHHPEEGGLAGAVRSDQTDASGGHLHVEIVDRGDRRVALRQPPGPEQHRCAGHLGSLPGDVVLPGRTLYPGCRTGKSVGLACNADR